MIQPRLYDQIQNYLHKMDFPEQFETRAHKGIVPNIDVEWQYLKEYSLKLIRKHNLRFEKGRIGKKRRENAHKWTENCSLALRGYIEEWAIQQSEDTLENAEEMMWEEFEFDQKALSFLKEKMVHYSNDVIIKNARAMGFPYCPK